MIREKCSTNMLIVATKMMSGGHNYDTAVKEIDDSLKRLQVGQWQSLTSCKRAREKLT
jgi:diketogulonate reductase-like aldo/keto reductase